MTKKSLISIIVPAIMAFLAVMAGVSFNARAASDNNSGQAQVKIGYVDFNKALNEVPDGVAAKNRLKDEFREKQQRLDLLQNELITMKDKIDRDRLILSSESVEAKDKAYRQKFLEVQQKYSDFRREMSDREEHLTEGILARLRQIVRDIGDKEGYSLILEKSQEVVLYAPQAQDLTDRVIAQFKSGKKGK